MGGDVGFEFRLYGSSLFVVGGCRSEARRVVIWDVGFFFIFGLGGFMEKEMFFNDCFLVKY